MFVNGSGRNEYSLPRFFHKCVLLSFTSLGWGVSKETMKMWKVSRWQTTDDGLQVMVKAHNAFDKLSWWGNNSQRVDVSSHSDTLFWFRANQSLLFLLKDAFLAEKQQIPILYSFIWPDLCSYPQYIALEASTLTITLPLRFPIFIFCLFFFLIKCCYCPSIYYLKTKIIPKQ